MNNFEYIELEDIIKNMIGGQFNLKTLDVISTKIDEELKKQNLESLNITATEFISLFENNAYFLKVIANIKSDALESCSYIREMKKKTLPPKNTILDLSFSLQQYRECLNMLKRYKHPKYSYKKIKAVIISDFDLFVSSFDSSISDTFSREYFIDKLNSMP